MERIQIQDEEIARLKDDVNVLKGEKKRPGFKGSQLDSKTEQNESSDKTKKRPGSEKRAKNSQLTIHKEKTIAPDEFIPEGSQFKGYRSFVIQELVIYQHNTRYRLECWLTREGKALAGKLPETFRNRHFGPHLISYILYQHHHCQTTQPLLLEQLHEWGIDISSGQINQLLLTGQSAFHKEKDELLEAGLKTSSYITVDDSGARHQGKNGYVTRMGNDLFAWFGSTGSKSRTNFLELLRVGKQDYQLTEEALKYMECYKLPQLPLSKLQRNEGRCFNDKESWNALLNRLEITTKSYGHIATEGALMGSVVHHGLKNDLAIISDDAGQFNILKHGLCWVHTERLIHKLLPFNEKHKEENAKVRQQSWTFYKALKAYKKAPLDTKQQELSLRFDEIFKQRTCFATLNQALQRIHKNKAELLPVLSKSDIPLHTNGSERDIRDYVKKRKISGGTRSDEGRRCRDIFISLKKSCRKLNFSFWQYLTDRLGAGKTTVPYLPDVVRQRAAATGY